MIVNRKVTFLFSRLYPVFILFDSLQRTNKSARSCPEKRVYKIKFPLQGVEEETALKIITGGGERSFEHL